MRDQPVVRQAIKAGTDVALEDPLGRCSQRQHPMALIDGVGRRSFQAEAIRVWLGQGFRDRIKGQQVERLHGSVLHTRNREGAFAGTVAFRDIHPAQWVGTIPMLTEGGHRLSFVLRRFPEDSIHPRSPFALVFRHPFDRQHLGGERVGQQTLQGSHLAPSTGLCRLHDTRLEPTHDAVSLLPLNGMPVHGVAGDRTSRCCHCCHLLCLLYRLAKVSRDARPAWEVSPLARGVMLRVLNSYPPYYRMAFASSRVPYPPPHRLALRLTFPGGRETGLPRSTRVPLDELGSTCSPVARHLRETMRERLHLATSLLGQAFQPLWLVGSHDVYRQFTSVSHVIPPSLPTALGLAVVHALSRGTHHLVGEATLSQELHTAGLPWPHVLVGY